MAFQAGTFSSDLQNGIRAHLDHKVAANLDLSKLSINRSTVILSSIGSLSKMKAFQRSTSDPGSSSLPPLAGFSSLLLPSTPPSFSSAPSVPSTKCLLPTSRSRRKSAHTVPLDDDSSDEPSSRRAVAGVVEDVQRARGKKRQRLYTLSKRRRRPRRHHLPHRPEDQESNCVVEPCAFLRCRLPQQDAVQWIQCDVCDTWYHIDCLHINPKKFLMDPDADFHCGCRCPAQGNETK